MDPNQFLNNFGNYGNFDVNNTFPPQQPLQVNTNYQLSGNDQISQLVNQMNQPSHQSHLQKLQQMQMMAQLGQYPGLSNGYNNLQGV